MSGDVQPRAAGDITTDQERTFIIAPNGEITGEIEQLKQLKLEFTHLSAENPDMEIDARKIVGNEVQVLLLDFGMPPRVVTISGDFRENHEATEENYTDTDDSSPNTLNIACSAYGWEGGSTNYYYDGWSSESSVKLRRGHYMGLTHRGEPAETRSGLIDNEVEIYLSEEYISDDDFSTANANLLTIGYSDHALKLHMHDSLNAFVIYGQSIGFADRHPEPATDPEELEQLLGRLAGEEPAELIRELFGRYAVIAVEHEQAVGSMETMEALLAHNKELLRSERATTWRLQRELKSLKSQRTGGEDQSASGGWFKQAFGTGGTNNGSAVENACRTLGLDPGILQLDPDLIVSLASMGRKAWSKVLHPDIAAQGGSEAEERLKAMNNAADVLIDRFKQK